MAAPPSGELHHRVCGCHRLPCVNQGNACLLASARSPPPVVRVTAEGRGRLCRSMYECSVLSYTVSLQVLVPDTVHHAYAMPTAYVVLHVRVVRCLTCALLLGGLPVARQPGNPPHRPVSARRAPLPTCDFLPGVSSPLQGDVAEGVLSS